MFFKNRSHKLLSKTTWVYLIFTFLAFFSSALFLTHETNKFIDKNMEHRFDKSEKRIKRAIQSGKSLDSIGRYGRIFPIPNQAADRTASIYRDTLIHNSEMDEIQRYRKKIMIIEVNGKSYRVVMIRSLDDFIRLRDNIMGGLIPAFLFLMVLILLFNYLLSGYFFRPFNQILQLMKTYQVGQKTGIKKITTTTIEFKKMQDLFHQMVNRIESDYQHLKEYTENMAHEIQTPLAIIRNKVDNLLGDEKVMKHQAESVKIIYDETNLLSTLGNTLNLLTRIENGEYNRTVRISTRQVIEKHVTAIAELVELKGLVIQTDLSNDHTINIDPFLLDIMIKNLLRNAVSYGTNKGPITIQTESDCLQISNFGPPHAIPKRKLFERFYRARHSKSSLGLGLPLVYKICQLNGLKITYTYKEHQHVFSVKENTH